MTDPKPLTGLLVLSLEQAVAAPYASSRLADAGARVIKIERPEGDFARGYDQLANGLSSYFVWLNRGKQSLIADIKNPADAALLHRILQNTDVLIQNLAPGAAARAGFASAALRDRHPRLITVDISGYGDTGDYATMKAYDLLVQAESSLAMITGLPAGPGRVGVSVCDIACGMAAHSGILEALIERGITGRGKGLKVSLFDGMADWMSVPLLFYQGTGTSPPRIGLAHPSICPYGAFPLADGSLVLIAIQNEREWARFLRPLPERARPAEPARLRHQRRPRRQPPAGGRPHRGRLRPPVAHRRGGSPARSQHGVRLRQRRRRPLTPSGAPARHRRNAERRRHPGRPTGHHRWRAPAHARAGPRGRPALGARSARNSPPDPAWARCLSAARAQRMRPRFAGRGDA